MGIRIWIEKNLNKHLEELVESLGYPISHYLVYEMIKS